MRRRALLACALSATVAGCTGDDPTGGGDENGNEDGGVGDGNDEFEGGNDDESDGENDAVESRYRVVVEAPESDPGDGSVCEFESMPDAAQDEFAVAIEGVDFETADRGEYTSTSSPAVLDTDCYNAYVAHEGGYYWVSVDAEGG